MSLLVVYPALPWTNQDIVLYHGTLAAHIPAILTGVSVSLGRPTADFGRGFYLTTFEKQARTWAAQIAAITPVEFQP